MPQQRTHVRISLQLPPALHHWLQEQAQHARRSLPGHIIWLLERTSPATDAVGPRAITDRTPQAQGEWEGAC